MTDPCQARGKGSGNSSCYSDDLWSSSSHPGLSHPFRPLFPRVLPPDPVPRVSSPCKSGSEPLGFCSLAAPGVSPQGTRSSLKAGLHPPGPLWVPPNSLSSIHSTSYHAQDSPSQQRNDLAPNASRAKVSQDQKAVTLCPTAIQSTPRSEKIFFLGDIDTSESGLHCQGLTALARPEPTPIRCIRGSLFIQVSVALTELSVSVPGSHSGHPGTAGRMSPWAPLGCDSVSDRLPLFSVTLTAVEKHWSPILCFLSRVDWGSRVWGGRAWQ